MARVFAEALPLRPNPGPEELPPEPSWTPLILPLGGAVALAGLFLIVRRWWGHRRAAPRPCHEIALAELDRIAHSKVDDASAADRFYVHVTGILRHYVSARFEVDAVGRTTRELTQTLTGITQLVPEKKTLLTELLSRADLVKFARDMPPATATEEFVQQVRQFICETARPATPAVPRP